ncbi:unconventional prefoldin RPB5 interactor 1 isoform X2 [Sturnira hondurensis]|uniref:unconventional prefoldin RPB5 interactor 1 isoform X2 n=1 Tax=Sturnira hondurensis TaxID=192404 RepID=UPI001879A06E|nr:unconventional prefoldin RPB5 interactor 1 isoform X2 [Sturnira hondurensis]
MEAPPDPAPLAAASASAPAPLRAPEVARLREEQEKVVESCRESAQHWKKVDDDYCALQERLGTLPDKLSYNILVPFGPFAFMPGKLVHTNEVTVLLGDNWFAKCSAKQAVGLVEHRKAHVRRTIDELQKVMRNFESRVQFTEDLQRMSDAAGDIVDIREEVKSDFEFKAKHRIAHKPHSKPKTSGRAEAEFSDDVKAEAPLADEALWARLEELERREALLGELDSEPGPVTANGEDAPSSEEEAGEQSGDMDGPHPGAPAPSCCDGDAADPGLLSGLVNGHANCSVNGLSSCHSDEEEDEDDDGDESEPVHCALGAGRSSVPTIHFSHTVEPKKVRINTGKNTTLKFSEKKEEAKRKRKNGCGGGHPAPERPTIRTPADIYRVFVDVVNGEYVPRKSILKSRSRENSVCSDTSESSAADLEERRALLRGLSGEEASCSDAGESVLEEEVPQSPAPPAGPPEAFSGAVIEKDVLPPCSTPRPAGAPPLLPPIPERKEVLSEASGAVAKRVSKFKAARLQQKI